MCLDKLFKFNMKIVRFNLIYTLLVIQHTVNLRCYIICQFNHITLKLVRLNIESFKNLSC